ncbi:[Pyruvate dehydrogenase [acetyl-transferring]]-phosphatase 1, mitochondrial [Monosporozyma servazzii]
MLVSRFGINSAQSSSLRGVPAISKRLYSVHATNSNLRYNKKRRTFALAGGVALSALIYVAYTSQSRSISSDVPHKKEQSIGGGSEPVTLLSDEEVNFRLRSNQQSYWINKGTGIYRYDISQLPSNNPIEDNHSEQILQMKSSENNNNSKDDLYFFGIYDGHGGPFTSAKLSQALIPQVAKSLIKNGYNDTSIQDSFVQLDDEIVIQSFKNLFSNPLSKENIQNIMPAISGACCLLSIYDSKTQDLKVAVTGDSRALIIGQDPQDEWYVKSCSTDQTGDNPDEIERIQKEHPKEPNVITRGRILGSLQPSRAFGDYRYKVKEIDGQSLSSLPDYLKLYLRAQPRNFLTPPYVTAKPEITTTQIDDKVKLMVMGSDGLFELLTNEEIAALSIKWLEHNQNKMKTTKLPIVKDISTDQSSQRDAFRYKDSKKKGDDNKPQYIMEDSNIATYLIRNALSAGGRREFVSTLVSIPSPVSRKYRDDLTVTVVFFGNDNKSKSRDKIVLNPDATTTSSR